MKLPLGHFLPSIIYALTLAGCSAESAPSQAGPCNELVHDGSTHSVALASNPPSPPLGGTISEGNYVLTSARLFSVPRDVNITRRLGASLQIRGDVIAQVTELDGALERNTFKYTAANNMLSLVDSCAASSTKTHGYSATSAGLEIFVQEPGTGYTLQQIFSKR
ncbi:MAG TPA: hypothetical protein VJV79_29585 [Polyangiaceae bacterium]|nr:hypothetical protein [Polyangiaceae bacterium]